MDKYYDTCKFEYYVSFGRGDASNTIEWEEDLTEEEAAIYNKALEDGEDLDFIPELHAVWERAYAAISQQAIDDLLSDGNEYVQECYGFNEMDDEYLTELVHSRDKHALEFFHLEKLRKSELEEWDAFDLPELPTVAEFYGDNFKPENPFENAYRLGVDFAIW